MSRFNQITDFSDIKFNGTIKMQDWIFNCDGLTVKHEKHDKGEYFDSEEQMIKWAEKKFNYYMKRCEKKNISPSVFIDYNPWM